MPEVISLKVVFPDAVFVVINRLAVWYVLPGASHDPGAYDTLAVTVVDTRVPVLGFTFDLTEMTGSCIWAAGWE